MNIKFYYVYSFETSVSGPDAEEGMLLVASLLTHNDVFHIIARSLIGYTYPCDNPCNSCLNYGYTGLAHVFIYVLGDDIPEEDLITSLKEDLEYVQSI